MKQLSPEESQRCKDFFERDFETIPTFNRLERNGDMFFCQQYTRVKKRNSFTIEYGPGKFGQIYYFILHEGKAAAVVQQLVLSPIPESFYPTSTLVPAKLSDTYEIIDIETIVEKIVFIEVSHSVSYVSKFPSTLNFD